MDIFITFTIKGVKNVQWFRLGSSKVWKNYTIT